MMLFDSVFTYNYLLQMSATTVIALSNKFPLLFSDKHQPG